MLGGAVGATGARRRLLVVCFAVMFWGSKARAVCCAAPVAKTTGGWVAGVQKQGVNAYLGVPFAAAPVDSLRFALPEAVRPWEGIRNTTVAASECVQGPEAAPRGSEDCLYANVFAPSANTSAAIIFLLHGGGFVSGSARSDLFAMSRTAGVVLVAPQYRLGVFGFACCDNVGLADQLLALRWTVANAGAFGGDASRLLVMGGSAGGASVAGLLVDSSAIGLFAAASLESPGGHQGWMGDAQRTDDDWMSRALSINNTRRVVQALGGDNLSDLVGLDAYGVWSTASPRRLAPSLVDANGEDDYPLRRFSLGQWPNRVPIIVGGVSCESCQAARDYLGDPRDNVTRLDFLRALEVYLGPDALVSPLEVETWYADRVSTEGYWRILARALSDSGHACSVALHARALAMHSRRVWRYYFAYTAPDDDLPGAVHGSDEAFILGDGAPADLSESMAQWWGAFARTGDPNHATSLPWPRFKPLPDPLVMFMGGPNQSETRLAATVEDTVRPECRRHWAPYLGWSLLRDDDQEVDVHAPRQAALSSSSAPPSSLLP